MTKAEKKAARHRRASREWMRRYRARKAEETDKNEPFNFVEPAASVILPQPVPAPAAAAAPEWHAPILPPATRPDPWLHDTSSDKYRPAFWDALGVEPAVIPINLNPRAVLRRPPIVGEGFVQVAFDPGIEYSQAGGHVDIAAQQAELEEQKRRSSGR
jgi:hypothetical protein